METYSFVAGEFQSSTKRAPRAFAEGRRGNFLAKLVSTTPRNERLENMQNMADKKSARSGTLC